MGVVDLDGTSQLCLSPPLSLSLCLSHLRPFAHSPGVNFTTTVADPKVDLDTIKRVLAEYRVHNADVHMRGDYDVDDIVDVIEGRCVYIPCIYAINKIDQITLEELKVMSRLPHYCPVSSFHEWNMDGLIQMVWNYLDLTRVYTKPKGYVR